MYRCANIVLADVNHQVCLLVLRRLVGIVHTSEPLDLALASFGVDTAFVSLFADFERGEELEGKGNASSTLC